MIALCEDAAVLLELSWSKFHCINFFLEKYLLKLEKSMKYYIFFSILGYLILIKFVWRYRYDLKYEKYEK